MKKKIIHDKNTEAQEIPMKSSVVKKTKIGSKKENSQPRVNSESKLAKEQKKLMKQESSSKQVNTDMISRIDSENKDSYNNFCPSNFLTEPIRMECIELKEKLMDQIRDLDFKTALDTVYILYAKAKLLHEVYGTHSDIYYDALYQLASTHLAHNDFEIAGKHFKRINQLCEMLFKAKQASDQVEKLKRSSLIGLLSLYIRLQQFSKAKKTFELLEEENLHDISISENLEIIICEAELLIKEEKFDLAAKKLRHGCDSQSIANNKDICPLMKIRYFQLKANLDEILEKFDEALEDLDIGINMADECNQRSSEDLLFEKIDLLMIRVRILGNQMDKKNGEQNLLRDQIIETYEIIRNILSYDLFEKVNEKNHKKYFSPLRKYIIFLSRTSSIKDAIPILDNLIVLESKYYGKFHTNLAKSLELKGKLYAKLNEVNKALTFFDQALNIFTEMNEKELAAGIQTKINMLMNKN